MTVTPEGFRDALISTYRSVAKRRADKPDLQERPFLDWMMKRKKQRVFMQGRLRHIVQLQQGKSTNAWAGGRARVTRKEYNVLDELEFQPQRRQHGIEFVITDLEDEGILVNYTSPASKRVGMEMTGSEIDRVVSAIEARLFSFDDDWDTDMDKLYHLDGSADPLDPEGLDARMPVINTEGNYGGQPRTNPTFRHHTQLGLTTGAGGTAERGLNQLWRDVHRKRRGQSSRIDTIFAGEGAIDKYVAYARANGMPYARNGGNSEVSRLDIAHTDSANYFKNISIIPDPTFEDLDAQGLDGGTPWTDRMYFLSSKNWEFSYQQNGLKQYSAPVPPEDQRIVAQDLDGRHCFWSDKINGQGLATFA